MSIAVQVCIAVDWSSGHAAHHEGALNVNAMNVGYGGKQSIPHASVLTEGCVGEGGLLKVGDTQ